MSEHFINKGQVLSLKSFLGFVIGISGLYNLGYWSTFEINIFSYYNINELINSFIYPFFISGGIILLFLISSDFIRLNLYPELGFGGAENRDSKSYKYTSAAIAIVGIAMIVLSLFFFGLESWLISPLLIWGFLSVFVINSLLKDKIIPHDKYVISSIQIAILVISLSFCVGKYNSLRISRNLKFKYILNNSEPKKQQLLKFLGKAGNSYFFTTIGNDKIVVQNINNIDSITFRYYLHGIVENKNDSIISRMIEE